MTNEEMQKTMQFLVEQQAHFFSELQSLAVIVRHQSIQIAEHSVQIARHSSQIAEHTTQIAQVASQIDQLRELLGRTVRVVDEQGRQTDDRINALMSMIERFFSNGKK